MWKTLLEYSPLVSAIVSSVGLAALIFLAVQVLLTKRQITYARLWNKLNATFTFFSYKDFIEQERIVHSKLMDIGISIDSTECISEEDVSKIMANYDISTIVRNYLNFYETYAIAVNIGALDHECAYSIAAWKMMQSYHIFKNFINKIRKNYNDNEIYIESEKLALSWEKRHIESREKDKETVARLQEELKKAKGVKTKV